MNDQDVKIQDGAGILSGLRQGVNKFADKTKQLAKDSSFGMLTTCDEDYNKGYQTKIEQRLNSIHAIQVEFMKRVDGLADETLNKRYSMGKPEEYGTQHMAMEVAYETYNFLQLMLNTKLKSLNYETLGRTRKCMNKIIIVAYAHFRLDKHHDEHMVEMDAEQQEDFNEVMAYLKGIDYKKMVDIFSFDPQDTRLNDIRIMFYIIEGGKVIEDRTKVASLFSTILDKYVNSLDVTQNLLTTHKNVLMAMDNDEFKNLIPRLTEGDKQTLSDFQSALDSQTPSAPLQPEEIAIAAAAAVAAMSDPSAPPPAPEATSPSAPENRSLGEEGDGGDQDQSQGTNAGVIAVAAVATVALEGQESEVKTPQDQDEARDPVAPPVEELKKKENEPVTPPEMLQNPAEGDQTPEPEVKTPQKKELKSVAS